MKKQTLIKIIWIIYLIVAIIFLVNALSDITGKVILEGTSVGISILFTFVFITSTILLILYNRRLRKN